MNSMDSFFASMFYLLVFNLLVKTNKEESYNSPQLFLSPICLQLFISFPKKVKAKLNDLTILYLSNFGWTTHLFSLNVLFILHSNHSFPPSLLLLPPPTSFILPLQPLFRKRKTSHGESIKHDIAS